MNEKYELTEEFKEIETLREGWLQKIKVYRIRALRAFADVKIGDLGGFVEAKCRFCRVRLPTAGITSELLVNTLDT